MKNILSIVVLSLLISWSTSFSDTIDYKKIHKDELDKCTKDGKWICEKSKIDEILTNYYKHGGQLKDCNFTSYKAPCRCDGDGEQSVIIKKYCEMKMKPIKKNTQIKMGRMEATVYCSNLANRSSKEIRNEYFKSCMIVQGF